MALTTINYNFQPIYYSPVDFSEYVSELHQDDDRSGFQNLGDGDNFIFRSATSDQFINAQGGDDDITLSGNTNDTVLGGSGKDFIDGGAGSDTLSGGSGNDTIFGGAGADHISGGSGDDILNGDNDAVPSTQHGADTIFGGSGNDTIYGGGKADILTGGSGADTFLYKVGLGSENESSVGAADHITDFQARVTTSTFRSWMPIATPPMATARSPCRPQRTPMPERSGSRATTTVSTSSSTSTVARQTWRSSWRTTTT